MQIISVSAGDLQRSGIADIGVGGQVAADIHARIRGQGLTLVAEQQQIDILQTGGFHGLDLLCRGGLFDARAAGEICPDADDLAGFGVDNRVGEGAAPAVSRPGLDHQIVGACALHPGDALGVLSAGLEPGLIGHVDSDEAGRFHGLPVQIRGVDRDDLAGLDIGDDHQVVDVIEVGHVVGQGRDLGWIAAEGGGIFGKGLHISVALEIVAVDDVHQPDGEDAQLRVGGFDRGRALTDIADSRHRDRRNQRRQDEDEGDGTGKAEAHE